MEDKDDHVRKRAYQIWEAEGRPDGRHDDHWHRAHAEVADAGSEQVRSPQAAPAAKAEGARASRPPKAAAKAPRKPASEPAAAARPAPRRKRKEP